MSKSIYYINGNFLPAEICQVPFNDAGFLFGDGLFETIRFQNQRLFAPHKHIKRLRDGLSFLHMKVPQSNFELTNILQEMIEWNAIPSGLLRLMITRGQITGTPWNHEGDPGIYVSVRPLSPIPTDPVKVVYLNESDYPIIRFNPAIKSMNYIGNMKAKKDAEDMGAYEPVFINSDGYITECAIRNIFYIRDHVLLTPDIDLGVLPGVMRSLIMEIAKKQGLDIEETHIHKTELSDMDEAFISSTGIGLLPCYWDEWNSQYPLTRKISVMLNTIIHSICDQKAEITR